MDKRQKFSDGHAERRPITEEQLMYLVPADRTIKRTDAGLGLAEVMEILWSGRWLIVCVTLILALSATAYALFAPSLYRAEVLLNVVQNASTRRIMGQLGGLGGLASLAGLGIDERAAAEPIAALESREFTRAFIQEQNLLPVLFASKWDARAQRWKPMNPARIPDIRDAEKYFVKHIRDVQQDKKSGLVTLSVEWFDPSVAAQWANLMVQRINERLRHRAYVEAQENVSFLRAELSNANVVTLQQSIGRLLDDELQKLMLAKGQQDFAFRIVDRAEVPKWRSWPKRWQTIVIATVAGILLGIGVVLGRYFFSVPKIQQDEIAP